jgi:hypothetical protein
MPSASSAARRKKKTRCCNQSPHPRAFPATSSFWTCQLLQPVTGGVMIRGILIVTASMLVITLVLPRLVPPADNADRRPMHHHE